jgi:hypothetical protein
LEVVLENPKDFENVVEGLTKVLIGFERFENPRGGLQNDVSPTELEEKRNKTTHSLLDLLVVLLCNEGL